MNENTTRPPQNEDDTPKTPQTTEQPQGEPSATPAMSDEAFASAKTLTMVIYGLYGAAVFFGITAVVAVIMNYVKRAEIKGTLFESHFTWQIRTFWWGLAWTIVGFLTSFIFIGWLVLMAVLVWYIYRVVRGFLRLNDNRPMYEFD